MRYVAYVAIIFMLAFAVYLGGNTSEQQHKSIEQQYHRCLNAYGYGSPAFTRCLK